MSSKFPEIPQETPSPKRPNKKNNSDKELTSSSSTSSQINAFTKMMAPKRKSTPPASPPSKKPSFKGRDALGAYITNPEAWPSTRIISWNDNFVRIHDMYPKSSVHALLLPRSQAHTKLHPFDVFNDAEFLAACKIEAAQLKYGVGLELRRLYGKYSKADKPIEDILSGETDLKDGEEMPKGRDWEKDVMVGVHAGPSMDHLHIHVLSVDRFSERMNKRKHYNSFNTGFFVRLEEFPLDENDERRRSGTLSRLLSEDLKCWRCGKNFGNQFARLKEHLAVEFEEWKRE
ncbi:hypothetical protein HYFRA_00003606 [Hymenoscyphus fraxineus]|uniref:Aprataxin-like protein n=1 Tax=Hymenoscyphus fraxineus TaxID=746836 RepID=A0A9N9PQW5_9HELO|nr:hypothetical protein HYFRA_00003606 [Hymenoscyphus fraxineus]